MRRGELITIRVSAEDRRLLRALAHHLQRSQSDTVRYIVRAAAGALALPGFAARADTGIEPASVREPDHPAG